MKSTSFAVLLALYSTVQAQSGDLIESSHTGIAKRGSLSQYTGGCTAPVVLDSGFNVTHRICPDTYPLWGKAQSYTEDGVNEGKAPWWYFEDGGYDHQLAGCKDALLPASPGIEKMDPKFATDYVLNGLRAKNFPKGVTEPNFWGKAYWPTVGTLYGMPYMQTIGFSLEFTGYYLAPQTGSYTFMFRADDGASLQFGSGSSCCQDLQNGHSAPLEVVSTTGGDDPLTPRSKVILPSSEYTVRLKKGVYYPMRVVYFNDLASFVFQLEVTRPDGTTTSDWSDVKIIDNSGLCH